MPRPTLSDVHVNRPLTNMSIAFIQDAGIFVATKVFPNLPVNNKSDLYFRYSRADFNRDEMQLRAPSTESAGGGYGLDTDSYNAKTYAFHKDVSDEIRANEDSPLSSDRDATIFCTNKALIKREKIWTSSYFKDGIWGTDVTGVTSSPTTGQTLVWSDLSSTPIEDLETGITKVHESTGFRPNTLVLGQRVWDRLKNHPEITDRVKFSGGVGNDRPAKVSTQALAQILEIDNVYVMGAVENTAAQGLPEASRFIGGNNALLCYANPRPSIMQPSAGYTFSWTGFLAAGSDGNRIKKFRMEWLESDRVEIEMAFDMKRVASDLGYFFKDIVVQPS